MGAADEGEHGALLGGVQPPHGDRGRGEHQAVGDRQAAQRPGVDRERPHPLPLAPLAPDDRPAAAGREVDQAAPRRGRHDPAVHHEQLAPEGAVLHPDGNAAPHRGRWPGGRRHPRAGALARGDQEGPDRDDHQNRRRGDRLRPEIPALPAVEVAEPALPARDRRTVHHRQLHRHPGRARGPDPRHDRECGEARTRAAEAGARAAAERVQSHVGAARGRPPFAAGQLRPRDDPGQPAAHRGLGDDQGDVA
mmetsp:Transcript_82585/g.234253  ORF Transcript_82585/g.234253 Transcript_82585/m.234253 type:complete len:250 (-) Transcript_82585:2637-3386(-)